MMPESKITREPCMEIFLECIKSESAKGSYQDCMRYFKDFVKLKKYQDIIDLDPKKLTQLIVSYIIFRKKNKVKQLISK